MKEQLQTYKILLVLVTMWCVAIVAAPMLNSLGSSSRAVGVFLYEGFSRVCHQMDERSLYIAGGKLGVCMRCSAIYFSFLLTLLVLPAVKAVDRLGIPSVRWLCVFVIPLFVDVLLNDMGIQGSTAWSRLMTGILAGAILPLYIVPPFLDAAKQIRKSLRNPGEFYARKTQ